MTNQYNMDKEKFAELLSKMIRIDIKKITNFLKDNDVGSVFNHPAALGATEKQLQRLEDFINLRNLYNNLSSQQVNYNINSSSKAGDYFVNYFADFNDKERFVCSFLNTQNNIIVTKVMHTGTIDSAPVYPREIAKTALQYDAATVILAHNHPGGSATPSAADRDSTNKISSALNTLNIRVLDHIIVAGKNYFSFADNGLSLSEERAVYNAKEQVVSQYTNEFPAIKNISEKTAAIIDNLNRDHGHQLSISEIKNMYLNAGNKLEGVHNQEDVRSFNELKTIMDDINHAAYKEKVNAAIKNVVNKSLEMEV